MWTTITKVLESNWLLFQRPKDYLFITAFRVAALCTLLFVTRAIIMWDGSWPAIDMTFATSIALALFSVGLSCAFYIGANNTSKGSAGDLRQFLLDMRGEQRTQFSDLKTTIGRSGVPADVRETLEHMQANPGNAEYVFQLLDSLMDETNKQFIILMYKDNKPLPRGVTHPFGIVANYRWCKTRAQASAGSLFMQEFCKKLSGTELIQVDLKDNVSLTDRGVEFAKWLISHDRQADYFESTLGGWGTLPDDHRAFFKDMPGINVPPGVRAANPTDGVADGDADEPKK